MNKRMARIWLGTSLVIITLFGCNRHQTIHYETLLQEASIILDQEKYILVVPQNGCSNCVKKSYDFILRNYANTKIKYVFTHYSSKKAVRIRLRAFGEEDHSRLGFIDLQLAQEYGISTFYPTLMKLASDGIANASLMNADDMSDWVELEKLIQSN